MEYINNIELQGQVGQIRVTDWEGDRLASISLKTERVWNNLDGTKEIETTWFQMQVCEGALDLPRDLFDNITNGDFIHVTGSLHFKKYFEEGARIFPEVIVSTIEKVIPEDHE